MRPFEEVAQKVVRTDRRFFDQAGIFFYLFVAELVYVRDQKLGKTQQRLERIDQVVGDDREELVFGADHRIQFLFRFDQFFVGFLKVLVFVVELFFQLVHFLSQ